MYKDIDIENMFENQKNFTERFYNIDDLSPEQKEELTKTFILSLHAEASAMAACINYKQHHHHNIKVSTSKLCHETVDVVRYALAALNVWGITSEQFCDAWVSRDQYLRVREVLTKVKYTGQPTVIVDVDDVIAGFRDSFTDYLIARGIPADRQSAEYYHVASLTGNKDFNSEIYYQDFIESHGLRDNMPAIASTICAINKLHDEGYWIQLLTARPADNPTCVYDTYTWLTQTAFHRVKFDRIDFASEKFLWLIQSEPYQQGKVVCAIDDAPKHAAEYAKHGVKVLAPVKSYNTILTTTENVTMYQDGMHVYDLIKSMTGNLNENS